MNVLFFLPVLLVAVMSGASYVYERPPLTDYQAEAYFHDARTALVEGATKTGKGHAGMAWLFEQAAVVAKAMNYWWVAPVYPQSAIAYRRLKEALPNGLYKANDSDMTITLPNRRMIWFKSGEKADNLFGEDVGAAIIDEASRLRQEAWYAVRSTLTFTRGPVRIVGNVKGRKNWFYQLCRKAEAGEPDMVYRRFTSEQAVDAGVLDAGEIEGARRDLPENIFRELYLAQASDDGGNPFGIDAIQSGITKLSTKPAVAYGVDLAKSVDYTVIIGLDEDGRVCMFYRFQAPWQETITRIRDVIKKVPAMVDSTGVGDPILEALQRGGGKNYEGFKFSSESKQKIMEGLAVAIQRAEVFYPDGAIVSELESYEYEYTRTGVKYSAPSGQHDDTVCALALAVAKRWGTKSKSTWRPIA